MASLPDGCCTVGPPTSSSRRQWGDVGSRPAQLGHAERPIPKGGCGEPRGHTRAPGGRAASLALDLLRTMRPRAIVGTWGALETPSAPKPWPERCVSREAVLHSDPGAHPPALGPAGPRASWTLLREARMTWGAPRSPCPQQASCTDPGVPAGRRGRGRKSCQPGPSTLVPGLLLALPALCRRPGKSRPAAPTPPPMSGPHPSFLRVPRGCDLCRSGLVCASHGV